MKKFLLLKEFNSNWHYKKRLNPNLHIKSGSMTRNPEALNREIVDVWKPSVKRTSLFEIHNQTVVHTVLFRLGAPTKCFLLFAGSGPNAGKAVV
jgi:hypothetical protein